MTAIAPGRTRRTAGAAVLCASLAVVGLAGCSDGEEDPDAGTNGVAKLSAARIQSKSRKAATTADSVRLSGSVVSKGATYKLDMQLTGDGGSGEVRSGKRTFQLLRVGEQLFLKADAQFWTSGKESGGKADEAAAGKLDGKYVKVPEGDKSYRQLSGFTDKKLLLDGLLTLHGKLEKGERGSTGGVRTIEITGDQGAGGTLDVSLEGPPYPLTLERAGGAGVLKLTDWGKDFEVEPPTKGETVDYGQELPSS
ncbi:hypothetical protein DY218_01775 [Streptomyces triticagri]|uniref:Lipoprotein n=1 Tax=Streptomyces triticagri TaxID=2293568 RepID=A0A372MBT7_9ACTN|nr:hypothetical protein [Streptomyces triticagri]RFU88414.1 hypothetical protein DY218_01775 [Streptomyces triticagri]